MKKLHLITVSGRLPVWAATAEIFYSRQLRYFQLVTTSIRPTNAEKEADAVLDKLPRQARMILLDVDGVQTNSINFAKTLSRWLNYSTPTLVIAGADGPAPAMKQRADETLSLSPLTFPHILARVVLVEQLFRADCILRNHPYPR